MILGLSPYFIILNFYVFGILGWIYESTFVSIRTRKPVNRGFLIGPLLPIYGIGATLVYVLLRPLDSHPSLLYAGGMIVATIAEYITSYGLEKIFHARWWDYTKDPYNFQGRIALIPSLFWGFLTLLLFDFLEPFAKKIIAFIPEASEAYVCYGLILITIGDLTYTVITTFNFRTQLDNLYNLRAEWEKQMQDISFKELREKFTATGLEFIEKSITTYNEKHKSFMKKNPFFGNRRIMDAFPTMKFIPQNKNVIDVKDFINNFNFKNSLESLKRLTERKDDNE